VVDIEADVPLQLLGDPGRLRQILMNLLGNAIKFTAVGEVLLHVAQLAVQGGRSTLAFTVSDTGVGIASDKLNTVFEAFAQEDNSITRRFGGTGLGLPISAKLAHALGGSIDVTSQQGVGSQFKVTIPFEVDALTKTTPLNLSVLTGLRVLVLDANAVSRSVMATTLRSAGMLVEALEDGAQALALLGEAQAKDQPFDLLLLDDHAAGLNDSALARLILQDPKLASLRRVMVSSSGVKGDAQRAHGLGFAAYLSKPCTRLELLAALARVVGRLPSPLSALVTHHTVRDEQSAVPSDVQTLRLKSQH
jgi:CheY-like chemotaxis protein